MKQKTQNKPSIIFMGTPEFAKTILANLYQSDFKICAVFAQPDKPSGRGKKMHSPPVAEFCKQYGLPLFQPNRLKDDAITKQITDLAPNFIVVAAFGKILSQTVLDVAKIDCINVHASILPEYRGAAPINHAILDGKTTTGVSIMRMVKELDAGPVYSIKKYNITDSDDAITVTENLAKFGATLLIETLNQIYQHDLKPIEQDHDKSTYAHKLDRELSPINWDQSAKSIFNQVRALVPWPVASTVLNQKRLKIYKSTVLDSVSTAPPGTLLHIGKTGWTVSTKDTDILIQQVQLEGKKMMNAFDLANGLRLKAGAHLSGG